MITFLKIKIVTWIQKVMVIRTEKTRKDWIKNAHLLLITYIFHKEPIFLLAQANKNKKPLLHKIVEMIGPWQCEAVFQNSHLQGLREVKFRWVPSQFLNPGLSARWLPPACRSHTAMAGWGVCSPAAISSSPISTRMPREGKEHRTAALGSDHRASLENVSPDG